MARAGWAALAVILLIVLNLSSAVIVPAYGEKPRILVFDYCADLSGRRFCPTQTISNLIRGEGFQVDFRNSVPQDTSLLAGYGAYVILVEGRYSGDIIPYALRAARAVESYVADGAGFLVLAYDVPEEGWTENFVKEYAPIVGLFGATPTFPQRSDATTRIANHPVTSDVRTVSYDGVPLALVSSDLTPLVLGNDDTWGLRNQVIVAAGSHGSGRVVLTGGGGWDDYHNSWMNSDAALLVKNAVYWITKMTVPAHTRAISELKSLQDEINSLKTTADTLRREIDALRQQRSSVIDNLPQVKELKTSLAATTTRLEQAETQNKRLSASLNELSAENQRLKETASSLQGQIQTMKNTESALRLDLQEKNNLAAQVSDLRTQNSQLQKELSQAQTVSIALGGGFGAAVLMLIGIVALRRRK